MLRVSHLLGCMGLAAIVFACGGGPTVASYAQQAEGLVVAMEAQFDLLDAEWESQAPTVEGARTYWEGRMAVRSEFLEGVRALVPPDEVAGLHASAVDIFTRITSADEALAARVATMETIGGHWEWVETPEGEAADAVLEEVFAFCRVSQEEFDSEAERKSLREVWTPAEARKVVTVAFGCPP